MTQPLQAVPSQPVPEVNQLKNQVKTLTAELNAAKAMVNEGMTLSLQFRTNLNLFQQAHQELGQQYENLKKQTDVLSAKVIELTAPKVDEAPKVEEKVKKA
jgi:hypothetical protein